MSGILRAMRVEVKHRSGRVLYVAADAPDARAAFLEALARRIDLRGVAMHGTDLRGADLGGVDLRDADLSATVLRGAELGGSDLRGADLRDADLCDAEIGGAWLRDADTRIADPPAGERTYADWCLADISNAEHYRHPLHPFHADLWQLLDNTPDQAAHLRAAIAEGRIDADVVHDVDGRETLRLPGDARRPAKQWLLPIRRGDIPSETAHSGDSEGMYRARAALQWIDEWLASRTRIAAALERDGRSG